MQRRGDGISRLIDGSRRSLRLRYRRFSPAGPPCRCGSLTVRCEMGREPRRPPDKADAAESKKNTTSKDVLLVLRPLRDSARITLPDASHRARAKPYILVLDLVHGVWVQPSPEPHASRAAPHAPAPRDHGPSRPRRLPVRALSPLLDSMARHETPRPHSQDRILRNSVNSSSRFASFGLILQYLVGGPPSPSDSVSSKSSFSSPFSSSTCVQA